MKLHEFIINIEVLLSLESKSGFIKKIIKSEDNQKEGYENFILILSDESFFEISVKKL